MTYWYLASPYAKYAAGPEQAFRDVAKATGALMRQGVPVFSPIAHSHSVCEVAGLHDQDHAFWMAVDKPMVDAARGVLVLMLPGWRDSKGVAMEIAWAEQDGRPVIFLDPATIGALSPNALEILR